uniref:Membrane protein n=1 Tax=Marinobacter nauticus TaxID=2743 RepID=A0A455WEQ1_MARNT|nr:membrane protein [Marinobacter nauticus]
MMEVSLDWKAVAVFVTLLGAWSGFLIMVIRALLARVTKDLDLRLDRMVAAQEKDTDEWRRVERELMELRADLPVHYVRREDYIRGQSVIEAKLDSLALKLENVQLKTGVTHES